MKKTVLLQKCIFMFCFPETWQTRDVFSEAGFLYLDKRKKQTCQSLITQTGKTMEKTVLKKEEAGLKKTDFT